MKVLHVVPGLAEGWNGIAVAARLIADGQRQDGFDVELVEAQDFASRPVALADEIWIHSMWTPKVWKACFAVLKARKANLRRRPQPSASTCFPRLVRMTHANLDPLRCRYHGWKKWLVAPIERWLFARTDRVVVTGEWEADWCRKWGVRNEFQVVDLKKFFKLKCEAEVEERKGRPLHVLYLGRRHPLKGLRYLEQAVEELKNIELRVESSLFGEEKEKAWEWCDVFCLPTLSENFGIVVAEALEHGKRVIATDGAPAWEPSLSGSGSSPELVYLRGYRNGTDETRVRLLREALERIGC